VRARDFEIDVGVERRERLVVRVARSALAAKQGLEVRATDGARFVRDEDGGERTPGIAPGVGGERDRGGADRVGCGRLGVAPIARRRAVAPAACVVVARGVHAARHAQPGPREVAPRRAVDAHSFRVEELDRERAIRRHVEPRGAVFGKREREEHVGVALVARLHEAQERDLSREHALPHGRGCGEERVEDRHVAQLELTTRLGRVRVEGGVRIVGGRTREHQHGGADVPRDSELLTCERGDALPIVDRHARDALVDRDPHASVGGRRGIAEARSRVEHDQGRQRVFEGRASSLGHARTERAIEHREGPPIVVALRARQEDQDLTTVGKITRGVGRRGRGARAEVRVVLGIGVVRAVVAERETKEHSFDACGARAARREEQAATHLPGREEARGDLGMRGEGQTLDRAVVAIDRHELETFGERVRHRDHARASVGERRRVGRLHVGRTLGREPSCDASRELDLVEREARLHLAAQREGHETPVVRDRGIADLHRLAFVQRPNEIDRLLTLRVRSVPEHRAHRTRRDRERSALVRWTFDVDEAERGGRLDRERRPLRLRPTHDRRDRLALHAAREVAEARAPMRQTAVDRPDPLAHEARPTRIVAPRIEVFARLGVGVAHLVGRERARGIRGDPERSERAIPRSVAATRRATLGEVGKHVAFEASFERFERDVLSSARLVLDPAEELAQARVVLGREERAAPMRSASEGLGEGHTKQGGASRRVGAYAFERSCPRGLAIREAPARVDAHEEAFVRQGLAGHHAVAARRRAARFEHRARVGVEGFFGRRLARDEREEQHAKERSRDRTAGSDARDVRDPRRRKPRTVLTPRLWRRRALQPASSTRARGARSREAITEIAKSARASALPRLPWLRAVGRSVRSPITRAASER
jgi:hypothetical protein